MKNKILKIVLLIVAIVLIVALVVVGVVKLTSKGPEKAINSFVEALKAGDYTTAKSYVTDETVDMLNVSEDTENLEMVKLYYKCLEANVVEVTKTSNQAVVKVEMTNKDLKTILQNYIQKALEMALSQLGTSETDEENMETQLLEYFASQFDSEEIQNVTTTVDVVLNKVDGEWKIVVDDSLTDAILPGLSEVSNLYSTAA